MNCRHCGTEIADKAIICFRCGASTTDPVRKPVPVRTKRSPLFAFVVLVLLVLLGLYLGRAGMTTPEPNPLTIGASVVLLLAAVVVLIRLVRRR